MHRLQRQDAKSRKTFKIKRNRSTIRASSATVTRSATVKVSGWTGATGHVTTTGSAVYGDIIIVVMLSVNDRVFFAILLILVITALQ